MRIIQSSWACNNKNPLTNNAGWIAPEYNLMSWALSCLQLKQYYNDVVLYADSISAKILIDTLQLPYSNVICSLDILNKYHSQLWALPKIYTYSQQEQPFLHIDGDVFIWQKFDDDLLQGKLIAQNVEAATNYYEKIMQSLESSLTYFPQEIIYERQSKAPILAYNAGIMGGTDIPFFKEYTSKAFEFVDKNINNLPKIDVTNFNIFFEQYLFYCLAKKQKKNVNVLIPEIIGDNEYKGFGDFISVPYKKQYLHLLGNYKKSKLVCSQLANRFRQDYPDYYYKIIKLFKSSNTPLFKDYYYFLQDYNDLTNRQIQLKEDYLTNSVIKHNIPLPQLKEAITIDYLLKKKQKKQFDKGQVQDLEMFLKTINKIRRDKFSLIADNYLYARDLNANQYFQYLFADSNKIYTKKIVAENIFEIVESKYDWTLLFEESKIINAKLEELANKKPAQILTVIIPECDKHGFTLSNIDELDIVIHKKLEAVNTIQQLLDELKENFDNEEVNNSKLEFETLIFGRIKLGLYLKTIKIVF